MRKYVYTVTEKFMKTVEVEADSEQESRDKLADMVYKKDPGTIFDKDCEEDLYWDLEEVIEDDREKVYEVRIEETLAKTVYVTAKNAEEAYHEALRLYKMEAEGFVLTADDFEGVEFKVLGES